MKWMSIGLAGMALLAAPAAPALAGPAFHGAQSAAELALVRALKRAGSDEEVLDNLFHRYGPVPLAKRVDYGRYLTAGLIARLRAAEAALVRRDCGGVYREGDICGMDYNPITCAQDDLAAPYLVRSEALAGGRIRIWLRGTRGSGSAGTPYVMAQSGGAWLVDEVTCGP